MCGGSMSTRRSFFGVAALVLMCGVSSLSAQPQGQAAAGAAPAAKVDPFVVTGEQGLIIFQVDAAKTAEWESAWKEIKQKLSALTAKPDYKSLGESMNMLKVTTAADPSQAVAIYVLHLNPPSKLSYDPVAFLFAEGVMPRAEADAIFAKIQASFKGVNVLPLAKVGG
jgi:hypothetical protein